MILAKSKVVAYLVYYGYLAAKAAWDSDEFRAALKKFQREMGLRPDGEFGHKTDRMMVQPRCAFKAHNYLHQRANVAKWPARDWGEKPLTIGFSGYIPRLSRSEQRRLLMVACGFWEAVCGIRFKLVDRSPEILIAASNIDGQGRTLAWMEIPQGKWTKVPLDGMVDVSERFGDETLSQGEISYIAVMCHEIGHALGILHLDSRRFPGQLMNPVYNPRILQPQDHDKKQASMRYPGEVAKPDEGNNVVTVAWLAEMFTALKEQGYEITLAA